MIKARKTLSKILIVSPLFIVLGAILIVVGRGIVIAFQIIALLVHELAHAIVAKKRGYKLTRFRLSIYGAKLTGKFEAIRPRDEIIIALTGPLINLILAGLFVIIWWFFPNIYFVTEPFVKVNLFTAVFNLLPIFPLDGGRILLAALSIKKPRQRVYKILRKVSLAAAIIFSILFFLSFYFLMGNISLAVISIFFFVSTIIPDKEAKYMRLYSIAYLSEKLKRGIPVKEVMVSSSATLLQLSKMLNSNYFYRFVVVDSNLNKISEITELDLEKLLLTKGTTATVLASTL